MPFANGRQSPEAFISRWRNSLHGVPGRSMEQPVGLEMKTGFLIERSVAKGGRGSPSPPEGGAFPDRLLKFRLRRNSGEVPCPSTTRSDVFSSLSKRPFRFFENSGKKIAVSLGNPTGC